MRAVLYAHDMEPITVLELTALAWDYLERTGVVRLAIPTEPMPSVCSPSSVPMMGELKTVTITAEPLRRRDQRILMLFTHDEENALLLRSALLPGQRHDDEERQRQAFARGFLRALQQLGL